jgi:hypothetical protein
MTAQRGTVLKAAVLAVVTFLVYVPRLHDTPMFLSPDEVIIAVDAHALATTGRDVEGKFLPLYFNIQMRGEERRGWFTPVIFYLSALCQTLLPFSEGTVRLPSVLVGTLDVVLMFFLARALFHDEMLGLVAAALLAMTPSHFMLSRLGMDYPYVLPFILGWLVSLTRATDNDRAAPLVAAGLCLGFGVFSYIAAVVMMPLYVALTLLWLWLHNRSRRAYAAVLAGFALPMLLLLLPWLVSHPTAIADTAQRYDVYDAQKQTALQGFRGFFSYPNVDRLASLFWTYFSPSFLFLSGGLHSMFSTRSIGFFLLPVAILLPVGIQHLLKSPGRPCNALLLAGFATAPAAAAIFGGEPAAAQRSVELMPFGVLLSTIGLRQLWTANEGRVRLKRFVAAGAVVASIAQFAAFYPYYFTKYRFRSAGWFGGNLPGALERMIELDGKDHPPSIYFAPLRATSGLPDIRNRWMDSYWRFYLAKHARQDLLDRTRAFDPAVEIASGSLVLGNVGDVTIDQLAKSNQLKVAAAIAEPDGSVFFEILRK